MQNVDLKFKFIGMTIILVQDNPFINDGYQWKELTYNDFRRLYNAAVSMGVKIQEI